MAGTVGINGKLGQLSTGPCLDSDLLEIQTKQPGEAGDGTPKIAFDGAGNLVTSDGGTYEVAIASPLTKFQPGGSRIFIYVSSTGNDITGNGTQTKPYATIPRANQDVPLVRVHQDDRYLIILTGITESVTTPINVPEIVGGHGYEYAWPDDLSNPLPYPAIFFEADIQYIATPTLLHTLNPGTTTQVLSAGGSNNILITDTSQTWTAGQWRGYLCCDADLSSMRDIIDNGTDWLLVSQYVTDPGTLVTNPGIYDYGADISTTASQGNPSMQTTNGTTGTISFCGVRIHQGYQHNAATCDVILQGARIEGFNAFNISTLFAFGSCMESNFDLSSDSTENLLDGSFLNVSLVPNVSQLLLSGGAVNTLFTPTQAGQSNTGDLISPRNLDLIGYYYNCRVDATSGLYTVEFATFEQCVTDCITVSIGGSLHLGETVTNGLTGGNAGYGVNMLGGVANYLSAHAPSLGGALGDVKVGSLAARSWTDIETNAPIGLQADVFGTGARMQSDTTTATTTLPSSAIPTYASDAALPIPPTAPLAIVTTTPPVLAYSNGTAWFVNGAQVKP